MRKEHSLISDELLPLSQEEIARFKDQFTSVLLRRCLKTIDLQDIQIAKQREEIRSLKQHSGHPRPQKNAR